MLRYLELFSWRARSRQIQCVYIHGPVITIAASVLILHENMTWIALLGGALTLLGLYISEMKPKSKLLENGCKMDA